MPKFLIRLEDTAPGSAEYRLLSMIAPDEETARGYVELFEARHVAFALEPEELAALQTKREPTRAERGKLHRHNQAEPYRIASVQQVAKAKGG